VGILGGGKKKLEISLRRVVSTEKKKGPQGGKPRGEWGSAAPGEDTRQRGHVLGEPRQDSEKAV